MQLERVRRHARDAARRARPVAAAARALQQPRDSLSAADLQHAVHRREVHAEVERRCRDDAAQRALAQPVLHPVALASVERAVMQRDRPGPLRARGEDRLVPDLGLRARVGEDDRALPLLDRRDDLRAPSACRGARPTGSARSSAGCSESTMTLLGSTPRTMRRAGIARALDAQQRFARLVEIADRGRQSPHARAGCERAQARERQLHLHAALGAEQLVPLVDDDRAEIGEELAHVLAREKQRQALGRGDERGRQPLALPRAHGGGRVAGARLERPWDLEIAQRRRERLDGVGGERAQRRDPEDAQRRRAHCVGSFVTLSVASRVFVEPLEQRPPPAASVLPVPVAA